MKVIVMENYDELSIKAARMVASQLILKPNSILGLATGDTPLGMYKELISLNNRKIINFSEVKSFNLDEYCGLENTNDQSYIYYMMENFFKHININLENIYLPNGTSKDVEIECNEYEKKIKDAGLIDLQVLGIGGNGHIGFNEPNINFEAETHLVQLDDDTIKANSRFFNSIKEVPISAISMGIKTIMRSKKIILLANGKNKSEVVFKAINGKITPDIPASILQLHNDVTFIIDKEAAICL